VGNATEEAVAASVRGRGDVKRDGQEHAKYNKGKDPLQGNDLDSDLSEGKCWSCVYQRSTRKGDRNRQNLHRVNQLKQYPRI
jgi:hypothetical protein